MCEIQALHLPSLYYTACVAVCPKTSPPNLSIIHCKGVCQGPPFRPQCSGMWQVQDDIPGQSLSNHCISLLVPPQTHHLGTQYTNNALLSSVLGHDVALQPPANVHLSYLFTMLSNIFFSVRTPVMCGYWRES